MVHMRKWLSRVGKQGMVALLWGGVAEVIDIAKGAGLDRIGLMTK